ncbi:hypothetical protein H4Q26_003580 [Puccinia striiformis f. sp. tritici PST-130]|nr:hypothetical protein H4Q26_003580 [Puccinia striiformis f. sp. tritici PST-130]
MAVQYVKPPLPRLENLRFGQRTIGFPPYIRPQPTDIEIMAAKKRLRTSMTTRSSTQVHPETSESQTELDLAIVSTADGNNSQIQPPESSPAIITVRPKPSSQPAAVTQSSNSEENHRKTTSGIWAHFVQSGQGMFFFS